MWLSKNEIGIKEIKRNRGRKCRICGKAITPGDFANHNFEYVKTKLHETWLHSTCINEELDKHIPRID